MHAHTFSTLPPPAFAGSPEDHRAHNNAIAMRQASRNPEASLRRARAAIDAALALLEGHERRAAR